MLRLLLLLFRLLLNAQKGFLLLLLLDVLVLCVPLLLVVLLLCPLPNHCQFCSLFSIFCGTGLVHFLQPLLQLLPATCCPGILISLLNSCLL